jgi:hypothetical protein
MNFGQKKKNCSNLPMSGTQTTHSLPLLGQGIAALMLGLPLMPGWGTIFFHFSPEVSDIRNLKSPDISE